MNTIKQRAKKLINRLCSPIGIEIIRARGRITDLHMYPEKKRPEIPRYVNIGAGEFYHPLWHNLDMPNEYYAKSQKGNLQIEYDLTSHKPMPFKDNTLKIAYTSHVLEHIRDEDVEYLFNEIYRCLEAGGCFRITCPDIDLEYDAYMRGDEAFWKWPNAYGVYNESIEQKFLDHFATALTITHPDKRVEKLTDDDVRRVFQRFSKEDALDFLVGKVPFDIQMNHSGDHINWFNYQKIEQMLSRAGFSNIYKSGYGQSRCPLLRNLQLFDTTCPELSVYVECYK